MSSVLVLGDRTGLGAVDLADQARYRDGRLRSKQNSHNISMKQNKPESEGLTTVDDERTA